MQFRIRKLYYNRNEIAMRHGKKIMDREAEWQDLKKRLAESKFRSRFRLRDAELRIIAEKGMAAVEHQCRSFILKRLAPADPSNDGRQTPCADTPALSRNMPRDAAAEAVFRNGTISRREDR